MVWPSNLDTVRLGESIRRYFLHGGWHGIGAPALKMREIEGKLCWVNDCARSRPKSIYLLAEVTAVILQHGQYVHATRGEDYVEYTLVEVPD